MDLLELLSIILPVIAFCGVSTIFLINIYLKIRSKFPVSVNCWFCNKWLKVSFELQNSFDCPFCEQYNGFNADGDYNKPIPAQHDELMNKAVPLNEKQTTPNENGLCNVCNNNQRLKIHQLAAFSPIDESNYDEEVERYQEQLERSYRLCPQCENTLKKTLQKQKSVLLGLRLSNLRSQGLSLLNLSFLESNTAKRAIFTNAVKYLSFTLAVLQLVEIVTCLNFSNYQKSLPINLQPFLKLGKDFIIIIFSVISTISEYFYHLYSFTNNILLTYLQKNLAGLNVFTNFIKLYASIIINLDRRLLISCMGIFMESFIVNFGSNVKKTDHIRCIAWVLNFFIAYARLQVATESQVPGFIQMFLCCVILLSKSSNKSQPIKIAKTITAVQSKPVSTKPNYEETIVNPPMLKNPESPKLDASLDSTRSLSPLSTSSYLENGFACFKSPDSHIFGQKAIFENPLTTSHFRFSPKYRTQGTEDSFSSKSVFSEPLNVSDETIKLNGSLNESWEYQEKRLDFELDLELDKLHLGTYPKYTTGAEPSIFKLRPKPVLSPPKLHNVTQSSWVAGGYWKSPNENVNNYNTFSNLSRSSSQSSGFGSQTSSQNLNNIDVFNSLPPSRNTSICGEFDKFSVLSEPAYYSAKNRVYPVLQCDQPVFIYPQKQNESENPFRSKTNCARNNIDSDSRPDLFRPNSAQNGPIDFRPSSSSSILGPNASFMSTKSDFEGTMSPSFVTTKSYLTQSFPPVNVLYKPNANGYVKGSLLQKWRDQNNVKNDGC